VSRIIQLCKSYKIPIRVFLIKIKLNGKSFSQYAGQSHWCAFRQAGAGKVATVFKMGAWATQEHIHCASRFGCGCLGNFVYSKIVDEKGESGKKHSTQAVLNKAVYNLQVLATKNHDYAQCLAQAKELVAQKPDSKDAWQWKGTCEFQTGDSVDAKASFNKLLALDPGSQPAKNYLAILNNPNSHLVNLQTDSVSRQDFETAMGFATDPKVLDMTLAFKAPAAGNNSVAPETALYNSSQSYAKTVAYFEAQLKNSGIKYAEVKQNGGTSFQAADSATTSNFSVNVSSSTPVNVQATLFK